uniref:Lipoprotein n=1 Tax=Vannella robusta TaxID=1487602 RepID=A0A7S4IWI7_9EUKA
MRVDSYTRNVFLISICFLGFLVFSCAEHNPNTLATVPNCVSPFCCNYCNVTYDFTENSCSQVLQSLIEVANESEYFTYQNSTSDYVYFVHTTISDCCPPGYNYYEDVTFNTTSTDSTSCTDVVGFSISRSGTCDLGNDLVNIEKLVNGTGLHYTGPQHNSGCEK